MSAIEEITQERENQISFGYTPEHDSEHASGEFVSAALAYLYAASGEMDSAACNWPWEPETFSFDLDDPRKSLVKAAALIVAEIERMDRQKESV